MAEQGLEPTPADGMNSPAVLEPMSRTPSACSVPGAALSTSAAFTH